MEPFLRYWIRWPLFELFFKKYAWAWPVCETVHFFGLALLVGIVGMFDLRMLGIAPDVPIAQLKRLLPWDEAEEVTFEGEPGTLTDHKLKAIRDLGVTRLSLGIEHFDDHILEVNGRAHRSKEIHRAYAYAREIGFPQINIDLIAGMVEETEENWRECVRKTIEMSPDSVTIYQMEVPYNTTIYQRMKAEGKLVAPVADWETKRAWVNYAFSEMEKAGYSVNSTCTVVKDPAKTKFISPSFRVSMPATWLISRATPTARSAWPESKACQVPLSTSWRQRTRVLGGPPASPKGRWA